MEKTTFNSPYLANGEELKLFETVHLWLHALYSEASGPGLNLFTLFECESIKKIQSDIHYTFKNKDLLITALTHSTFCYEFEIVSNERLEFLGDSLVNFIVAKILYKKFPTSNEGELSKLRSTLVNEHSLALLAKSIMLGENLLLGKGEFKNNGQQKDSLLADAFEALCAALYLDSFENAEVLEKTLLQIINRYDQLSKKDFFSLKNLEQFDSKTQLQEIVVALFQLFPTYKSYEDKNGCGYRVELWIGDRLLGEVFGLSKKKCEKELARFALDEKKYLI